MTGITLRESHPSEDLSELPPLIESVAGQGYHYRRTGSSHDLPKPPQAGWGLARFLRDRLLIQDPVQEAPGASSRRCPFRGSSAKVIQLPDIQLSKNNGGSLPLYFYYHNSEKQKPNLLFKKSRFCQVLVSPVWIGTRVITPSHFTTDIFPTNHTPLS